MSCHVGAESLGPLQEQKMLPDGPSLQVPSCNFEYSFTTRASFRSTEAGQEENRPRAYYTLHYQEVNWGLCLNSSNIILPSVYQSSRGQGKIIQMIYSARISTLQILVQLLIYRKKILFFFCFFMKTQWPLWKLSQPTSGK